MIKVEKLKSESTSFFLLQRGGAAWKIRISKGPQGSTLERPSKLNSSNRAIEMATNGEK